jgi:oxygen-independent coproporphyrinogen-3 oxidase
MLPIPQPPTVIPSEVEGPLVAPKPGFPSGDPPHSSRAASQCEAPNRVLQMAPLPDDAPVGIYIHIPFCRHICPYCDFNTYRGLDSLVPRYVDALVHDIASHPRMPAQTVYFGGGTPSLLAPEQIGGILDACRNAFELDQDAEITLEANPNGVDAAWFAGVRATGVNRLSIGAQTFDRKGLRVLGRQHEAADVIAAIDAARGAGFDNLSLDLIFGWPGQTLEQWRLDLQTIASLPIEHCSLYSLIVEPGTPMADAVTRGVLTVLDDDTTADLYEIAMDTLGAAGWTHYEIANWARQPELASRHNLVYWRNGAYAAFGAGAHGRIGSERYMDHLKPLTYVEAVESGESPQSNTEFLDANLQMGETMMLGLRLLNEGVSATAFERRHRVLLLEHFGSQIDELSGFGLLDWDGDRLRLTLRGTLLANDVCARFL